MLNYFGKKMYFETGKSCILNFDVEYRFFFLYNISYLFFENLMHAYPVWVLREFAFLHGVLPIFF